ncbi:DUF418 domain-containing protein [Streptomyces sp. NPDC014744]|uniref:DUF418 domain-containing protein n=1 Tax=Streptomyces sp. NPDC014744 TaxID=3364903 RepID=UPI0036F79373
MVTAPLPAAAYTATVLRLVSDRCGRAVVTALAPAGRMPLTNYLGQSLVSCTGICGVPDARVAVLAEENHQHHGSTA